MTLEEFGCGLLCVFCHFLIFSGLMLVPYLTLFTIYLRCDCSKKREEPPFMGAVHYANETAEKPDGSVTLYAQPSSTNNIQTGRSNQAFVPDGGAPDQAGPSNAPPGRDHVEPATGRKRSGAVVINMEPAIEESHITNGHYGPQEGADTNPSRNAENGEDDTSGIRRRGKSFGTKQLVRPVVRKQNSYQ